MSKTVTTSLPESRFWFVLDVIGEFPLYIGCIHESHSVFDPITVVNLDPCLHFISYYFTYIRLFFMQFHNTLQGRQSAPSAYKMTTNFTTVMHHDCLDLTNDHCNKYQVFLVVNWVLIPSLMCLKKSLLANSRKPCFPPLSKSKLFCNY